MDTINVHEVPDATIIYTSANNVCTGDTVTLKANFGDGNTYKWSPAVFFTPTANDGLYYVVQGLIYHTGYVRLDVTTKFGCKATDSTLFTAQPCCGVYFPNAFSPNGDGRNDYFRPITNGHHEVETFRITNRWGQVVYESKNERDGWNGTYNGKPQDMGTYYYYYHYRCSDGQYLDARGEFVLMR
jgi:gliding motility-associated-like protein